jgi:hypothetical protein
MTQSRAVGSRCRKEKDIGSSAFVTIDVAKNKLDSAVRLSLA